jgi:hypothetical protein
MLFLHYDARWNMDPYMHRHTMSDTAQSSGFRLISSLRGMPNAAIYKELEVYCLP